MTVNLLIKAVVLLGCLFLLGCQPDGGDLSPVLQENARLTSFAAGKNNALQYDNENFSVKCSGSWESIYGEVSITIILKNRSSRKVSIDFNKATVKNTLSEPLEVTLVSTAYNSETARVIESKIVELNVGETKAYNLQIGEKNRKSKSGIKYRGNEIQLTVPVAFGQSVTNYNFKFKYDDHQQQGEYNENLID